MAPQFTPGPLAEQVGTARATLRAAVGVAFTAAPGMRRAEDVVAFAIVAEEVLRAAQSLTIAAAAGLVQARAHEEYQLRGAAAVLNVVCRVDTAEARRRVFLAGQVMPRVTLHGEPLPAKLPALAAAVYAGEVTAASAHRVAVTDAKIAPVVTDEAREALIGGLLDVARTEDDAFVGVCAKRTIEDAHPDGTEPADAILRMRQGITFGIEKDGLIPFAGCMTRIQYETVISTIGTFTNPRLQQPNESCDDATRESENSGIPTDVRIDPGDGGDPILVNVTGRPRPQLLLDGIVATCELAARTGRLPRNGGVRPTVIVTVPFTDLREQLGTADTTFAGPVPAGRIRQIACDAGILPLVLGSDGQVLDAGVEKRLVDGPLRKDLIGRDGGCAFPQCDLPATWTDAHHVIHWADPSTGSGQALARPAWRTRCCCVASITLWCITRRGRSRCGTASRTSCHRGRSTRTRRRDATTGTVGLEPKRSSGHRNPHHHRPRPPTPGTGGHEPSRQGSGSAGSTARGKLRHRRARA